VTLSSLYHIPAYQRQIVGLIIPGIAPVSAITQQILDDSGIPYIRISESTTAETYSAISGHISKISAEDDEKIDLICSLAEKVIDFEAIDRLL